MPTQSNGRTANLRPFPKGQSGNPGGRAKGLGSYIRKQTKEGKELADFMLSTMRNVEGGRIPLPVRMEAATWLADRGFGKPVQATEITGRDGGPIELSDADLERKLTADLARIAAAVRATGLLAAPDDERETAAPMAVARLSSATEPVSAAG